MVADKVKNFMDSIKKDLGSLPPDLHITRKASALVAISGGRVIKTQKPKIKYCPLFKRLFDNEAINKRTIKNKFFRQTKEWGMFTSNRKVCDERIIVPFGASEMLMYALKRKNIEAAVTACDGAGTIITSNPAIVQGIGAYMNGLFYTSPIEEVIEKINSNGGTILSPKDAKIDQLGGVKKAIRMGLKNIAVTVRGDQTEVIKAIRDIEGNIKQYDKDVNTKSPGYINKGIERIIILAVCNTGVKKTEAEIIKEYTDLAWSCASKFIRKIVGTSAILQVGMKIPVFIITKKGLDFISSYSSDSSLKDRLRGAEKKYYITANKYEKDSIKINMGKFSVFLYETKSLPMVTSEEPEPLI